MNCAIWVDSLWNRRAWQQAQDTPRLRQAFMDLAANARRWPTMADLVDRLPPKPTPRALPAPRFQRTGQRHLTHIKEILANA